MYLHKIHNIFLKLKIHFTLYQEINVNKKKLLKKSRIFTKFFTLLLNVFLYKTVQFFTSIITLTILISIHR